jgi:hypothetical protein
MAVPNPSPGRASGIQPKLVLIDMLQQAEREAPVMHAGAEPPLLAREAGEG